MSLLTVWLTSSTPLGWVILVLQVLIVSSVWFQFILEEAVSLLHMHAKLCCASLLRILYLYKQGCIKSREHRWCWREWSYTLHTLNPGNNTAWSRHLSQVWLSRQAWIFSEVWQLYDLRFAYAGKQLQKRGTFETPTPGMLLFVISMHILLDNRSAL